MSSSAVPYRPRRQSDTNCAHPTDCRCNASRIPGQATISTAKLRLDAVSQAPIIERSDRSFLRPGPTGDYDEQGYGEKERGSQETDEDAEGKARREAGQEGRKRLTAGDTPRMTEAERLAAIARTSLHHEAGRPDRPFFRRGSASKNSRCSRHFAGA